MFKHQLSEYTKTYFRLVLNIRRMLPNFVTHYYGPKYIMADVVNSRLDQSELMDIILELKSSIPKDYDDLQRTFLEKQFISLERTLKNIMREEIDYKRMVKELYDIYPSKVADKRLEEARSELFGLFHGRSIPEAVRAWKNSRIIPHSTLREKVRLCMDAFSNISKMMIYLPETERCEIEITSNKSWRGYSTYHGNYRSLVSINQDFPFYVYDIPRVVAHETYPGHHTEHCMKEKYLVRRKGFTEAAVQTSPSPQRPISNALGEVAWEILFEDLLTYCRWVETNLNVDVDPEFDAEVLALLHILETAWKNITFMIQDEKVSIEEATKYAEYIIPLPRKEIDFMVNRIRSSTPGSYFQYFEANDKVREMIKRLRGDLPKQIKLYSEPLCFSTLDFI